MKNFSATLIVIVILAVSQIFAIGTHLKSQRPPVCKGGCANRCDTHTDCPEGMDCYADHICRRPPEPCSGELCGQPCESHKDCLANQNCYTDKTCRDPCKYSMKCGLQAKCRNIENQPECYCPRGTIGDPVKECFDMKRSAILVDRGGSALKTYYSS